MQAEEYDAVWTEGDWARANGWDGKDVGIDLVAKLRNEDGFAAIQAKFYATDTRIQKSHIDSFISASGKEPFRRRVVLDSTEQEWGTNAEEMIRGQAIPVVRIGLTDLRESRLRTYPEPGQVAERRDFGVPRHPLPASGTDRSCTART